ncbi:MAG: dephospho-CoA kinase [Candidatus Omnitrophica bacterium]|nr:dephospho-CoA kinase [Candidatus Omnitrophota bacterium]
MLVVGLTGNIGSGKTTVLKLLKAKGAPTFNCDQQIHKYYRNRKGLVYKKLVALFPEVLSRGRINRKLLSEIVFSDPVKLKKLERVVHPLVIKDLTNWIKKCRRQARSKIAIAEVPLLFEKKLTARFDLVVLVKLKLKVSLKRLNEIYGFSKGLALKRLSFYCPLREKIKRADFVIDNSGKIKELTKEVDLLWKNLKQK